MPPAATVIIPTHNRKQDVEATVRSLLQQSIPLEVLVMDDASTDGTTEAMRSAFAAHPQVVIHRFDVSQGPTRRRNEGAELATTPYLFTIDDDFLFPSTETFRQTLSAFDDPRIGAVTLPYINIKEGPRLVFAAPDARQRYITTMFHGGMVAFRREAYLEVGGYRTFYFMNMEEPDLCVRLLQHGYLTQLGTAEPIHHLVSPRRNRRKINALTSRNSMLYHWYNTPLPAALLRLPGAGGLALLKSSRAGYPYSAILGLFRGVGAIFHERKLRKPVRPAVHRVSRQLKERSLPMPDVLALLQ